MFWYIINSIIRPVYMKIYNREIWSIISYISEDIMPGNFITKITDLEKTKFLHLLGLSNVPY